MQRADRRIFVWRPVVVLATLGAVCSPRSAVATPPTGSGDRGVEDDTSTFAPGPAEPVRDGRLGPSTHVRDDSALSPKVDPAHATHVPPGAITLTLEEVITSLDATHPLLESADAKIEERDGKVMSSRGAFDPTLSAEGRLGFMPNGKYTNQTAGVGVSTVTPFYGLGAYAGWRIGLGNYPIYAGKDITGTAGELRAGVSLPLWKDGIIDARRAALRQAELGRDEAGLMRLQKRLELEKKASKSYFDWVAADRKLAVEQGLLELAEQRDDGIRRQVERGNLAPVEAIDNRRQVLSRRGRVIGARREVRQKALEVSLYARDADGSARVPDERTVPADFPPELDPNTHDVDGDVERANELRPELAIFRIQRGIAEVDARLARNQRAPNIDVRGEVSKDLGQVEAQVSPLLSGDILPVEFGVGMVISIPIPLRKARGALRSAQARQRQVDAELSFAADQVEVEIRQAHAAWAAAYGQLQLARENTQANERLAELERTRFEKGDSDLLRINLREVSAASAAKAEIEAHAAYHQAFTEYLVAAGIGVSGAFRM